MNPTTGKHYRGINVLILGMDDRAFTSGDPRWCTYQQAKDSGWQVRKGEKIGTGHCPRAALPSYSVIRMKEAGGMGRSTPLQCKTATLSGAPSNHALISLAMSGKIASGGALLRSQ